MATRFSLRLAAAGIALAAASAAHAQLEEPVATENGLVQGVPGKLPGITVFKGIPFGAPPVGELRWKAPQPVENWEGVRKADSWGNVCVQGAAPERQPVNSATDWPDSPPMSEDCLYLNVWTPGKDARDLPVMIYNHGGGVDQGSGGTWFTLGANLARTQDVVVVTHNHRLGALGFLYLDELGGEEYAGSANQGLSDIALVLEWVQRNIEAFGGNPDNVMIFGESGGGLKTSCLYAMPRAAPTFHKASIESGPGIRLMEKDQAAQNTEAFLAILGLDKSNWRDMLAIPATAILDAQQKLAMETPMAAGFGGPSGIGASGLRGVGPVRDEFVFPDHPFDPAAPEFSRDKPLMTGGNRDEQTAFSIQSGDVAAYSLDEAGLLARVKQAVGADAESLIAATRADRPGATPSQVYMKIASDLFSGVGSRVIAQRKLAQGAAPVFLYDFAYQQGSIVPGTDYPFGANHGLDMPVKFDNTDAPPPESGLPDLIGTRPERIAAAHNMSSYWAGFARVGRPEAEGLPEWEAYSLETRPVMVLDAQCSLVYDPRPATRKWWDAHGAG